MKKIAAILFLLIAISCENKPKSSNSLIDHIPKDTQIIIKINDTEEAASKLRDNHFIKNNNQLAFFKYFKKLPVIHETKTPSGLLCFSPKGKNDFDYTYISRFDPAVLKNDSLDTKNIEIIEYNKEQIYKISSKEQSFFATRRDSVLIASSSQLLIENAIRTKEVPVSINEDLQKVYEVSGTESPLSILANGKKLQSIHNILLPNTDQPTLQNFSGWISLDATIEQNAMYLDGIAIEKDSLSSTIGIFDNTIAQENKISQITPITANGFISYTYDDYTILKKNLSLAQDREFEDIPDELDELLSNASEIGMVFLEKEKVLIVNSLEIDSAKEYLGDNRIETYRNIPIYSYNSPASFSQILTPLISDFEAKYFFVKDKFIVFGNSIGPLKDIIANVLNQTLLDDQGYYKSSIGGLSDESSILIATRINYLKDYISENCKDTYVSQWGNIKNKGYEMGVVQITKENDFAHVHSVLQKSSTKGAVASVSQVASTTLENKVLNNPILVKNHRTKGMDVAVQDIENTLYLISDKGAIFWKKQIDGEILGDIKQIDIYKNGRYQLLFNTAHTLYLVDRDGKDVAPYPKKFEKTITQPLALFDYDKNKRYRVLITQGNKVTMLDAKSDIVSGFTFKNTETDLILPPKHIRIKGKDYILLSEQNGKLTILDRLGKTRVSVKEKIDFSKNEWYQYLDKFTSTTKGGNLIQIQKDGNAVQQNMGLEHDNHVVATNKTLVTFSENKLAIKGKTIELDFGVYTTPKLYVVNDKIYITITDLQSKKVYLYDSNAELFPNFPVYGNSVLSIGNMDKDPNIEFVVKGEDNGILLYQIN